jgi:hypothetical protein
MVLGGGLALENAKARHPKGCRRWCVLRISCCIPPSLLIDDVYPENTQSFEQVFELLISLIESRNRSVKSRILLKNYITSGKKECPSLNNAVRRGKALIHSGE